MFLSYSEVDFYYAIDNLSEHVMISPDFDDNTTIPTSDVLLAGMAKDGNFASTEDSKVSNLMSNVIFFTNALDKSFWYQA